MSPRRLSNKGRETIDRVSLAQKNQKSKRRNQKERLGVVHSLIMDSNFSSLDDSIEKIAPEPDIRDLSPIRDEPDSSNRRVYPIYIEKFVGKPLEDFDEWLSHFESQTKDQPECNRLILLRFHLEGRARFIYESFETSKKTNWNLAVRELKLNFSIDPYEWLSILSTIKLCDQDFKLYAARIRICVNKGYPNITDGVLENLKVDYFINGLGDEFGRRVRRRNPTNLYEAIDQARDEYDELHEMAGETSETMMTSDTTENQMEENKKEGDFLKENYLSWMKTRICYHCRERGHIRPICPRLRTPRHSQ